MLTKTQFRILGLFASSISKVYGVREVARLLFMNNSLAHRNIAPLVKDGILTRGDKGYLALNFRKNHSILAFVEFLRSKELLLRSKDIPMLKDDIIKKFPYGYFVLIVNPPAAARSAPLRKSNFLSVIDLLNFNCHAKSGSLTSYHGTLRLP